MDYWLGLRAPPTILQESLRKRIPESCDWMLYRDEYTSWLSSDFSEPKKPKVLWIHGPAGFGKTTLCARIVWHASSIMRPSSPVAYYFFSRQNSHVTEAHEALRHWISQIANQSEAALRRVRERITDARARERERRATKPSLVYLLRDVLETVPGCTLIVDAVDECKGSLRPFLQELRGAIYRTSTRVLIVSLDLPRVQEWMATSDVNIRSSTFRITPEDTQADVSAYARALVKKKLPRQPEAVRNEIATALADRNQGDFLWVKLQASSLRKGMSPTKLLKSIHEAPLSVASTYGAKWDKIVSLPVKDRSRVMSLMRWATFALRPLTVAEITEAVLMTPELDRYGDLPFDYNELPDSINLKYIDKQIVRLCESLIEVRPAIDKSRPADQPPDVALSTVHLTHLSLKQHIMSVLKPEVRQMVTGPTEHTMLARVCLYYLNFPAVGMETQVSGEKTIRYAFRNYADQWWHKHYRTDTRDPVATQLVHEFFDKDNPAFVSWVGRYERLCFPPRYLEHPGRSGGPLYWAARLGFSQLVAHLLTKGYNANEPFRNNETPVLAAISQGHTGIVRQLMMADGQPGAGPGEQQSPLHDAAYNGGTERVRVLLSAGVGVNQQDRHFRTPLYMAVKGGHPEIVRLLIERGAQVNTYGIPTPPPPLHTAVVENKVEEVRLLIQGGADVNLPERRGGWASAALAATYGYAGMLEVVLEAGADVNARTDTDSTPLLEAVSNGHADCVRILLDRGANVSTVFAHNWGLLHYAVHHGFSAIVEMLIGAGADINGQLAVTACQPLHLAVKRGQLDLVEMLVDAGCDIDAKLVNGETALDLAVSLNNQEVADYLRPRMTVA